MKRKLRAIGVLISLFGWLSIANAQEEVFQRGIELGIGARAMGMGGSYVGIADDYSAGFWNPAGLTQIRRLEGFATFSYTQRTNDASFNGWANEEMLTTTRINSIGLAYPVPTYQGSLVFSLGYHRVKPFDSSIRFEWLNETPEDSVTQRWSELEEGSLNNWAFAGALEVAPNFSLGASLNLWTGKDDYQLSFTETDAPYDLYTFDKFRIEDNVVSTFSGFNVKLAGMYRPISNFRLGFTVGTPVTYTVKDEWRTSDETTFDDPGTESTSSTDAGQIEYKIRSPFSFGVGASLNLVNLLVAAGVESNDWSQIRYVSDPPFSDLSKVEANEELAYRYRQTLRYHLGAEFTLPIIDLQLRGGYFYDPTPLSADYYPGGAIPEDANREFFTAGVGIFLDKQVRLDVGAITGTWRDYKDPLTDFVDDTDDDVPLTEKITFNKVFASLAIRF